MKQKNILFNTRLLLIVLSSILCNCQGGHTSNDCGAENKHQTIPEGFTSLTIPYAEFHERFEKRLKYEQILSQAASIDEKQRAIIFTKTWSDLFEQYILRPDINYLGLGVTQYEIDDMVFGNNPHKNILSLPFLHDDKGVFRPDYAKAFVARLRADSLSDQKLTWDIFVSDMTKEQQTDKIKSILNSAFCITPDEESFYRTYMETEIDFDYFMKPYHTLKIKQPNDSLLNKYYNENAHSYVRGESRKVTVVTIPPDIDPQLHRDELTSFETLKQHPDADFKTIASKSANIKYYTADYNLATTSGELHQFFTDGKVGDIKGPYFEKNSYKLVKIVSKQSKPDSVKIRHIMLKGKDTAHTVTIMNKLTVDKSLFAELASKYSSDNRTSTTGGELGWITPGDLVEPFNTACFSAPKDFYFVVETINSKHIMHLIDLSETSHHYVTADVLYMPLEPNAKDIEGLVKTADEMYQRSHNTSELLINSSKKGYSTDNVKLESLYYIFPNITDAYEMIQWSFKNNIQSVSKPFFRNNNAYILTITDILPTGPLPLYEIRGNLLSELTVLCRRDSLYDIINPLVIQGGTLEENAQRTGCEVIGIKKMKLASYDIPSLGEEVLLRGKLMGMKIGETSPLFKGDKGLFMIRKKAERKIVTPSTPKTRLQNQYQADISNKGYMSDLYIRADAHINVAREYDSYALVKEYNHRLSYDTTAAQDMIDAETAFRKQEWQKAISGDLKIKGFKSFYENDNKQTKQSRLARLYAGLCYINMQHYADAIEVLLPIDKTDDFIFSSLLPIIIADSYAMLSDREKAKEYYKKAVENGISTFYNVIALHKLAIIAYMSGNEQEAINYCNKLLNISSDHYHVQVTKELLYKLTHNKNN